jgi:hypothetical protein
MEIPWRRYLSFQEHIREQTQGPMWWRKIRDDVPIRMQGRQGGNLPYHTKIW